MADLPYSSIVNVSLVTSPQAVSRSGFGVLNIITKEEGGIPRSSRYKTYNSTDEVAADWATSTEAYKAAATYFSQSPRPTTVMISTRYEASQSAILRGGSVVGTVDEFKAVTAGAFDIVIDGVTKNVTGVDLSGISTLEQVAPILTTALGDDGVCSFDGTRFTIETATVGSSAKISYLIPTASSELIDLLRMGGAEQNATIASGIDGETITASLQSIADKAGNQFYGFQFTKEVRDKVQVNGEDAVLAAADWAESQSNPRVFFNTTNDLDTDDSSITSDIASQLAAKNLKRTITTYSSYPSQYPSSSVAGRAFTVNFNQPNATITLMFKQLPTITVEELSSSQAAALQGKKCNFFAKVGASSIYQTGVMANGQFFDEVHGTDWLVDAIQVDAYNVLYSNGTKIPYTNAGVQRLIAAVRKVLNQAVLNGLGAAGYVGEEFLAEGFKITYTPVEDNNAGNIAQRHYDGIQFILKGAGAIQGLTINGVFER